MKKKSFVLCGRLCALVSLLCLASTFGGACSTPSAAPAATPLELQPPPNDAGSAVDTVPERQDAAPPSDTRQGLVIGAHSCENDGDCVPARCCHPAECVARSHAPTCKDVMCTMECRPVTLDCGGRCVCHEGRCAAKLNDLGPTEQGI